MKNSNDVVLYRFENNHIFIIFFEDVDQEHDCFIMLRSNINYKPKHKKLFTLLSSYDISYVNKYLGVAIREK